MQDDFDKDLSLNKKTTKATLGRYLKNTEKILQPPPEENLDNNADGDLNETQGGE